MKSEQYLEVGVEASDCRGNLLTGLLSMACSAFF